MSSTTNNDFDFFITDLNGNQRGKRLPGSSFSKILKEGMKLPRSVVGLDIWGDDCAANGLVFETGDSDGVCMPVSDTLTLVPWAKRRHEQALAMMFNPDGSPFLADPRQILASVVDRYKAEGITVVAATELEFYLMDITSEAIQRPKPPVLTRGHGRQISEVDAYSITELDGLADFFADVREACAIQNIPADTIISELGPGQFEINLNHIDNPLLVADQAILFKRLVKGVARKHNLAASFMAKPYMDQSGNGFHVHFSLLDENGDNIFDNGGPEGTDTLRHAIGGLMVTMADSMLAFAPNLNSYRRFQKGAHAPTYASWGYENRTVALRVPESPNAARRIEHRVSGADANPYLVLASILSGALHGMENKIEPSKPVVGDAYSVFDEDRALPNTWEDAITALENSDLLKATLGSQYVRVFTSAKRQEQASIAGRISDLEYESYLGLL
jgi:glutamine synthetase